MKTAFWLCKMAFTIGQTPTCFLLNKLFSIFKLCSVYLFVYSPHSFCRFYFQFRQRILFSFYRMYNPSQFFHDQCSRYCNSNYIRLALIYFKINKYNKLYLYQYIPNLLFINMEVTRCASKAITFIGF